jgi:hypothetical protein
MGKKGLIKIHKAGNSHLETFAFCGCSSQSQQDPFRKAWNKNTGCTVNCAGYKNKKKLWELGTG